MSMGSELNKNKRWLLRRRRFYLVTTALLAALLLPAGLLAEPVQAWRVPDMAGHMQQLANYKGQWVVLNFWATWCPPCLEEMPELVAFHDAHARKDAVVLGVAVQYPSEQAVRQYVDDMLISYPVMLGDAYGRQLPRPEVLPTSYIYAPDGSLYKVKRGPVSRVWLENLLKEAAPVSRVPR